MVHEHAARQCASLYNCNNGDSNVTLSVPDSQCNYNHSGTLCGGCQPGLSLALESAQCLQCSSKYLALLIPFALAGPAVVFFVKILELTISQGTVNGLIFYANIVKASDYMHFSQRQTNSFHYMVQPGLGCRDLLLPWSVCLWLL